MYTNDLGTAAQKGFTTLWNDMSQKSDLKSAEAIHGIQRALQCCGNEKPQDWNSIAVPFPSSCCAEGSNSCSDQSAFPEGCSTQLYNLVSTSGMLIAWISVVFAAFEVRNQLTK